jgi:iron complex outermembrane recepter protein
MTWACHALPAMAQQVDAAAARAVAEEVRVVGSRGRLLGLDEENRTGSRLGLTLRELPASVSVVTQQDIQLRGARTALEAIEAAVGMTGMTGVGSIPSYATRGFSGADITVMRDGIRQNTSSQASRPLDSFLFDRIEVLKGPASLLYGEGAIGGAVNYVSKQASDQPQREVLISTGSWGRHRLGFGAAGPTGAEGLSYRADVSVSRNGGYVDHNQEDYTAAGGELLWEATERTSLRLGVTVLEDAVESYYGTPLVYDAVVGADGVAAVRPSNTSTDRLINARIEPASRRRNYNIADNFSEATNTFWRAVVDSRLGDRWTLHNEAYAATQKLEWYNAERNTWNPATQLVDRGGSVFLIWRDDLQIGNRLDLSWSGDLAGRPHRFLVGVLYDRNDQGRNSGQPYSRDPIPASIPLTDFDPGIGPPPSFARTVDVLTRTVAVYLEDVLDITDGLKLVSGLRYDSIDIERESYLGAGTFHKSYSPLTGRLGLIYEVSPDLNAYVSYSRAAQPVSQLVSLDVSHDDFSLQKGRQLEAGIKASLWRGRADLTVALFDIEKNDLLTSTFVEGERFNSQIGAQVAQGAEWELGVSLGTGWRLSANLARTWTAEYEEFNENLGSGVISRAGNSPSNVPKTVASLFVSRDWGAWSVNAAVYHVGERQANNNNGIHLPSYTKLDASVTRRWRSVSFTLRGRNLTDELYAVGSGGGGLMWRLDDPRSVEAGLRYEF